MLGPTMPLDMMSGLARVSAGARRATAHEGFFAVLRELAEAGQARGLAAAVIEQEPAWRITMAGMVTMRLVDRWANSRAPAQPAPTLEEIESVQRAIVACESGAIPNILTGIVLAVTRWWARRSPVVLTSVLAYARLLDGDEQQLWALAEDVYSTFLAHARTTDEFELVPNACVRLGRCRRHLGRLTEASAAYEMAIDASAAQGDAYNALLARTGAASVVRLRGDLPAAEALLDAIVLDAQTLSAQHPAYFEPLARALHERAYVAYERKQFECAVTRLYDAMRSYTEDRLRDNALHDLALVLVDLGQRDAGRDAFIVLRAAGATSMLRWSAAVNLLQLAAGDGDEATFDRLATELAAVKALPPFLAAHYYLQLGEGSRRFGRAAVARNALARAIHIAEQHRFNQILIMAEQLRAAPGAPAPSDCPMTQPPPSAVAHVTTFVRELRELATAGEAAD
jgi:tetratricopeptide (TPR) repeat protein